MIRLKQCIKKSKKKNNIKTKFKVDLNLNNNVLGIFTNRGSGGRIDGERFQVLPAYNLNSGT